MKKLENMSKAELLDYINTKTCTKSELDKMRKAMENHKQGANKARNDKAEAEKKNIILENTIKQVEQRAEDVYKRAEQKANEIVAKRTASVKELEVELNYTSHNLIKTLEMLDTLQTHTNNQQLTINKIIEVFKSQYISVTKTEE
jgi:uncharacterized protein YaiL (DUF2058 family)